MSGNKRKHVDPLPRVIEFLDSILQVDTSAIPETIPLAGRVWNSAAEQRFLVVRDCYTDLFSFCESCLAVEAGENPHLKRYAIVTGTAGTGKTYFGLYATMRWFAAGKIVRLWIASKTYIVAKELEGDDPLKQIMSKHQLSNGLEVWYHESLHKAVEINNIMGSSRRDFPAVYTIRDSGSGLVVKMVQSDGPVLYTISSGHDKLLKALLSKTTNPAESVRRYSELWGREEFLNESIVATYEAYIKSQQNYVIDPQNESFNKESYRYRLYLDEGYRRYGGSARLVLKFIDYAGICLASQAFDSIEDSLQVVRELPDEQHL